MKKIFTKFFLLAIFSIASFTLSAQTYNGGTWYSLYDANEYSISVFGSKTFNVFTPTLGNLTFEAKRQTAGQGNLQLIPIVNGEDQSAIFSNKLNTSYASYSLTLSNENTTQLKFYAPTGVTLKKYFKNIKLPLKKHILIADGGYGKSSESKSFENVTIGGTSNVQTVNLRSFLTNGDITITSDNSAFRIGSANNTSGQTFAVGANACASTNGSGAAGGGNLGAISNYAVNIYFCPTEAKEYSATITITDGTSTAEISVSGVGVKKNQSIVWDEEFSADEVKLPVGKEINNIASATSALEISYSFDKDSIISIEGTTIKALKSGVVILTATQVGNNEWNGVSAAKTITVTEKIIQAIHWEDYLRRLKIGGDDVTLSATAMLLTNAETNEYTESPERTALITYSSNNNAVVSVDGKILKIIGEGETSVVATLPGDEYYEAITIEMPVKVSALSSFCEAYVLDDAKERELNTVDSEEYSINGPAHQLTFTANRTALWGFTDGNLKVDAYYNGEWHKIFDEDVTKDNYKSYGPITLDRNTTKLKFYTTTGATGYKHIKDVLVTQATYLETTTPAVVVEKSIIGDVIEKSIQVQYSNLPEGVLISNTSDKITLSTAELDSDCGKYGEQTINLTIVPTEVGTIEDVITIEDEATKLSLNIPVTIHTQRNTQTIIWNDEVSSIYTTDNITFSAEAKTAITYESSDNNIAEVQNNQLIIKTSGVVTITATAAQDEKYEQATATKNVTINIVTPTITMLPTVDAITYGATFEGATLLGGEANVSGAWQWNDDLNQVLDAGMHNLKVQFVPSNTAWYSVVDTTISVTVNKAAAILATAPIAVTDLVYNATAQTLIVTGVAEGGTMQYSLDGESYTSDLPTATSAGTYTVYYKVVADANHTDVEVATLTATIAQAPLTITAEDYNILYGEAAPTYTATYIGWQGSDDAAVLAGTLAYSCDYVAGNNVGTYTITPSGVTAANYAIQFVAGTLTVNQVAAAVATAPIAITDLVYNATAQTLIVAGVAEGGTMQYSLDGESYTSDLPTATSAGTYTVYYKVVADANHTDVEVATLTATIAQAPLTITAEDYNILYGEAAPTYTATYIGWQGSDDAAVLAGTLAYSCDYVAGNNVGTYTITPSGVTAANYAIQFVAGTLTVNQVAAAVATAPIAITDLVYNATAQTLIVAGVAEGGTMQYSLDGESYTSDLPTATSAGTYTVYYKVVADANHTDVEVATLTATIAQAPLTITAEDYNILYGEAAPTYTATYIGWQGSDDAAVLAGTLAYSCDYVAGNNVGTYTITPSGVTAANYAIQFVAGTLTVNQVAAAVATAPIAITDLVYNATAQTLIVAGVAEGGTMQYSLDGESYTSDLPTATSAGTYTVYYKVVADANHTDVEVATLTATIAQASQFIEWELTNFVMEVGDTLHLTATATSGLEVTYTLDDDTYAEINGNLLIALQVGTFTVTASQDGVDGEYANYLAAESVAQSITIVAKDVNTHIEMILNEVEATKIIRDGCLYIIRNNRTYNVNGQVVE